MAIARWLARPGRYAALLAGALPVAAFPAPNLELAAWFGLVPGLLLLRAAPTQREAAIRGCWFGTGYLLAGLYWLAPNLGPALLLVTAALGLLWSGLGLAAWRLLRAPVTAARALAALAVVPGCWVAGEWIRSWQAIGGPWAVLGASQWQHPAVLGLAAVGGIWLVSLALVTANTGLVIALTARRPPARVVGAAAALIAIAGGPVAFAMTAPAATARRVTVALVQPGLVRGGPASRLAASERLTAGPARGADLIVWAESSVGYDLRSRPVLLGRIRQLSARVAAPILASQDAVSPGGAKSKDALMISARGIEGSYVKTRLVPFGEYIPLRGALGWLAAISRAAPVNMVTGTGARVLRAPLRAGAPLPVGVLICFESAFPDMARVDAARGAQVIIYQTSDSTFQASWALAQHASLGAVRAAETGRPVVQAALTGDSAAFDDRGRLLAWAGSSDRRALRARLSLPPGSARTPYDRLGDYIPWSATGIAAAGALLAVAGAAARRRPLIRRRGAARIGWDGEHGAGGPPLAPGGGQLAAAGRPTDPEGDRGHGAPAEP